MALIVKYHLIIKSAHQTYLLLDNEKCFLEQEGLGFSARGQRAEYVLCTS
jgi:hypothetical protein